MNNDNLDLQNIWQQQKVSEPNKVELIGKLQRFKSASIKKLIIANVTLIGTIAYIAFIWYQFQPQFLTTKIGILVILFAILIFLFSYNKLFSFLYKIDNTKTNSEYLQNLLQIKAKQKQLETTILSLYHILLSFGLCLYMYEYTSRMTMLGAVSVYSATLIWIAISWFYFRPKKIKKQQAKIDDLIGKFEAVNRQLGED